MTGCGGDEGTSESSDVTSATADSDPASNEPATTEPDDGIPDFGYEGGNIIKVFKDNDLFSILLDAVEEADLTDLLEGDQPLTIFAPADKAFKDLPDGVLEKLLKPENRDVLIEILKYHIVEGTYRAPDIATGDLVTLQGSPVAVEAFATDNFTQLLKVNGKFAIIPNLEATNGLIHVINWVMLPPGLDLASL